MDSKREIIRLTVHIFEKLKSACFGIDHQNLLNGLKTKPNIDKNGKAQLEKYLNGIYVETKKMTKSLRVIFKKLNFPSNGSFTRFLCLINIMDLSRTNQFVGMYKFLNTELASYWHISVGTEVRRINPALNIITRLTTDIKTLKERFTNNLKLIFGDKIYEPAQRNGNNLTDNDFYAFLKEATQMDIDFNNLINSMLPLFNGKKKICQLLEHLRTIVRTCAVMNRHFYEFSTPIKQHTAFEPLVESKKIGYNRETQRDEEVLFPSEDLSEYFGSLKTSLNEILDSLRENIQEFIQINLFEMHKMITNINVKSSINIGGDRIKELGKITEEFQSMNKSMSDAISDNVHFDELMGDLNGIRTTITEANNFDFIIYRLNTTTKTNARVLLQSQFVELIVSNDLLVKGTKNVYDFLGHQNMFARSIAQRLNLTLSNGQKSQRDQSNLIDFVHLDIAEFDDMINKKLDIFKANKKMINFLNAVKSFVDLYHFIFGLITGINGFNDQQHYQSLQLINLNNKSIYDEINMRLHLILTLCDNPLLAELSLLIRFIHNGNFPQLKDDESASMIKYVEKCDELKDFTLNHWLYAEIRDDIGKLFSLVREPGLNSKLQEFEVKNNAVYQRLKAYSSPQLSQLSFYIENIQMKIKEIILFLREQLLIPVPIADHEIIALNDLSNSLPFIHELINFKPFSRFESHSNFEMPMQRDLKSISDLFFDSMQSSQASSIYTASNSTLLKDVLEKYILGLTS